jgi:hypothetical protein
MPEGKQVLGIAIACTLLRNDALAGTSVMDSLEKTEYKRIESTSSSETLGSEPATTKHDERLLKC